MAPPIPPTPLGICKADSSKYLKVELFLDFCCPFSKKTFEALYDDNGESKLNRMGVSLMIQQVPQPWHPQSAVVHEFALLIKEVAGEQVYMKVCKALFAAREQKTTDEETYEKSRKEIHSVCCDIAVAKCPELNKEQLMEKLANVDGLVQNMKWAAKYHRCRGIHVTPTVLMNDLEAPDISSSWTLEQYQEKIDGFFGN